MLASSPTRTRVLLTALATAALALTAGCGGGSGASGGDAPGPSGRTLTVIASTNVWGSVVSSIAGPGITVDSIIKDPNADPHSYQSTPADAAALTRADLIVWNGGGYDDFVKKTLDSDPSLAGKAVDAFSAHQPPNDDNEHVWFDPNAVKGVITQVTDRLAAIEPAQGDALRRRAAAATDDVTNEANRLAAIGQAKPGSKVYSTEPIAHYLLNTAGVADTTPTEFSEAIENENDPPAATVSDIDNALSAHQVNALVFNPQTETPVTQQIRDRAQQAGVPVVDVTETLPDGLNYQQWLDGNRTALAKALGAPA